MRENFPHQDGGTWYSNMYREPGGLFFHDYLYQSPQLNYIFTAADPYWTPTGTYNLRKARFGLASASLGQAAAAMHESSGAAETSPNYLSGTMSMGVDLTTGRANETKTGWLGFPKGGAYQMITTPTNPDLVPAGTFAGGLNGWTTWSDPRLGPPSYPKLGLDQKEKMHSEFM